jgi:hypothetical protein
VIKLSQEESSSRRMPSLLRTWILGSKEIDYIKSKKEKENGR